MKIALTGGTGFIGSHFLRRVLCQDEHVVVAIRRSSDSKPRILLDKHPIWLDRQLNDVTIEDLKGCDVFVHLATHSGNIPYDSLANCIYWNCTLIIDLFEKARLAGIKSYIVAGSCFEYGRSGNYFPNIPTYASLEPTNSYAASKAIASVALRQWAEEHGLAMEILRIFHVYGQGELESRFWPSLKRAAYSGYDFPMTKGEQLRDFQPVSIVARALLERAINISQFSNYFQIFNLSSGNPLSIRDFAQSQWNILGARGNLIVGALQYRDLEIMRFLPGPQSINLGDFIDE